MDNFAWPAYLSEADDFDRNDFMSNGQPSVHHDINAYPSPYLGPGQAQGEIDQSPGHNMLGHIPLQDSSNISSSPPESTPERPALANQSPETQTTKSPKRSSGIGAGASDHRFACQLCSFSTNTKRDYTRHLRTRKHRNNANIGGGLEGMAEKIGFHCPVPDCKYSATGEMFSREGNLWRHIRKVHNRYQEAGVIASTVAYWEQVVLGGLFLHRPAAQANRNIACRLGTSPLPVPVGSIFGRVWFERCSLVAPYK